MGDLGGQRENKEFTALRWRFASLCWSVVVICVVGGNIENLMTWGGALQRIKNAKENTDFPNIRYFHLRHMGNR